MSPCISISRFPQLACLLLLAVGSFHAHAAEPAGKPSTPDPARGLDLLLNKPYLPPDFDQETFDGVWQSWPEPLRVKAEKASADERRNMAFKRYGLIEREGDVRHRPIQYVVDDRGQWHMNCLACHSGSVAGKPVWGVGNSHLALEALTEEIRTTKLRLGKKLTRMDLGLLVLPLGTSNGTTNAVMFGVALMSARDPELNVVPGRKLPPLVHHDMDAPAWWHYHRKSHIYIDGFVEKNHRALMQFMLVKENGPEKFKEWEEDFRHIQAWIESLRPPKYPHKIDSPLAERGRVLFENNCVRCHGSYDDSADPKAKYPEKRIPLATVKTDGVRLGALSAAHRAAYGKSWFTWFGKSETVIAPAGYVAPPLNGVWASAPYFHNGSVPTLWHVLHPDKRPLVWRRTGDRYDFTRIGWEIEALTEVPADIVGSAERRAYFDSRKPGKSSAGHPFADGLNEDEKRAVLEYLKSL